MEPGRVAERAAEVRARHGAFLLPALYTPALSENYVTDGPKLRQFVKLAWRTPESPDGIDLDLWQAWLLDRLLERYPCDHPDPSKAGRLRYRQVVVSIPRQNGKSVIGAILAMYGLLMHVVGPAVISVASTAEQARIVYDRVLLVVQASPDLRRRFAKMTETRGITTRDGAGTYRAKASKGDVLQGIPVSLALADELHITKPPIWQALVNGILTRKDGLVAGITTAGDDESELLKTLYALGKRAAEGDPALERFGYFVWQAPEPVVPADDADLAEALLVSNPALYEGRLGDQLGSVISDVRGTPDPDVIRYRFNLFVGSSNAFLPLERWLRGARPEGEEFPRNVQPVFAIDRTPDWGYATITANAKVGDLTHTEVVASLVRPTLEQLADVAQQLSRFSPTNYVMDGYTLRDLGAELKRRGLPVYVMTGADVQTASSLMYAKIMQRKIRHSSDELLSRQIPRTVRKNSGEGFRISRKDSGVEIDAVMATAFGIFGVETRQQPALQIF